MMVVGKIALLLMIFLTYYFKEMANKYFVKAASAVSRNAQKTYQAKAKIFVKLMFGSLAIVLIGIFWPNS